MSRFSVVFISILAFTASAFAAARSSEVSGVVNLNTASDAELRQLPGVGAKKAQAIADQRAKRKFDSPDQIMKVKGIGLKSYRFLKPHLAVSGPTNIVTIKKGLAFPKRTKAAKEAKAACPKPASVARKGHGVKPAPKPVAEIVPELPVLAVPAQG